MKHVKQLESFLNEGAFHVALYKARNEGAKEFEFKDKMYPVKEKKVDESAVNEDWGSSDQATMNRAIHKDMGNPSRFPSPFDDKLRSAAADAVDFWWDEWPEYKRDREGLIDDAIRAYYRSYFPKEFAGFTKMFSESTVNEGALSKSEANHLAHKMLNYAVDNGMIPASKKTKEHVDSMTDSLFNAKLDLKKDPRGAAHKILNGLVDRGLIPASKKTEDHISTLEDRLKKVELYESLNESGVVNTGNAISQDLTNFLKEVVVPKSKGYVHGERDAAALLYDVLRHRYNLG